MAFFSPTSQKIQYGVGESSVHVCLIRLEQGEPVVSWHAKPCEISDLLPKHSLAVCPLLSHTIWRKTVFLPKQTPQNAIYPQIIRLLQQSLPLPLDKLQFDYDIRPLDQAWKITVFARRKDETAPPSNDCRILDCEWHCTARALLFLNNIPFEEAENYHYPIGEKYLCFHNDEWQLTDTPSEQTVCLNYVADSPNPDLYLKTLGAALWGENGGLPNIDLNGRRQRNWIDRSVHHLTHWLTALFFSIVLAILIWIFGQTLVQQDRQLSQDLQKLRQKQQSTEQQLEAFKQNRLEQEVESRLSSQQVTDFLTFLNSLKLNGGLELAQLTATEQPLITLTGQLKPSDFATLEQFLKQQNYRYHIAHLQTTDQAEMEFNLNIEWEK